MEIVEEKNLDELMAQFRDLEKSSVQISNDKKVTTTFGNVSSVLRGWKNILKSCGIYIYFFVFTLILIIALQPFSLYEKIEESDKYKFKWKKFFMTWLVSFFSLSLFYFIITYYFQKI
jgi:hypothetical protein